MADHAEDFDRWFRAEYRRVLGAVIVVCAGDVTRAEDATNDAFVKAYERWDRVQPMASPRAWVTKVAINNAKRSFLLRARQIALVNTELLAATDAEIDVDLWAAVDRLTVRQRSAMVMRYVEDLPQAEVAQRLDVAVGTAAATLNQARSKLRTELEGEVL